MVYPSHQCLGMTEKATKLVSQTLLLLTNNSQSNVCVCVCVESLQSCVTRLQLWTIARQAPLPMGFSRQEYWGVLPCPPPGDLPNPGVEPTSLMVPALAGRFFTTGASCEASQSNIGYLKQV